MNIKRLLWAVTVLFALNLFCLALLLFRRGESVAVQAPPAPAQQPAATGVTFVVQEGQDLFDIAVRFGVSPGDIKALNNMSSDMVTPGQTLQIPVPSATDGAPSVPSRPVPLRLQRCEQISLSSNRLPHVRLVFNGAVDTNALVSRLTFKAEGQTVPCRIAGAKGNLVQVDLLEPVPGTLVLATVGEGVLPAQGASLFLPSTAPATVGCALSAGLAIRGLGAERTGEGGVCIQIQLNQRATAEDVAPFIHVSPPVNFTVSAARHWWDDSNRLTLNGPFEAARTYRVSIDKGLRSANGEMLMKPFSDDLTLPSLPPSCSFASLGRYLAPSDDFIVPVRVVNVTNVTATVRHLLPANIVAFVMRETDGYGNWYNWDNDESDNADHLIVDEQTVEIPVRAERNKATVIPCALGARLKAQGCGAYLVTVSGAPEEEEDWPSDVRIVCFSDIGLSLFVDEAACTAHVWTTTLSTGAARPGVEVSLYSNCNELLGKAVSDAAGLARIPFRKDVEPLVVVGADPDKNDLTFLPVTSSTGVNFVSDARRPYLAADACEAYLFTGRGIFRPGETVFLQALVRDGSANAPAAFPVELRVNKPDGKLYRKFTLMPDVRGALKAEIPVPEFLPSGRYRAILSVPGANGATLGEATFLVESFVPPQIRVAVTPAQESLRPGDTLDATLSAEHLYGSPAEGLQSDCGVTLRAAEFKPAGWERYVFGDPHVTFNGGAEQALGEAPLDAEGRRGLTFAVPDTLRAPARAKASVRATVFENGGRTVTAYGSVIIDTAPYYLGLDTAGREWVRSGDITFAWAAVRPDGTPEPGVATLKAKVVSIDSNWSFTIDEDHNFVWHCDKTETTLLEAAAVPPCGADGQGLCTFRIDGCGEYRLVLTDTRTGASASHSFYASPWEGEAPARTDSFTKLEITPDRKSYVPGDLARLQIRAPFAGELLLVLKQGKVLQTRSIAITNRTVEVALPVTASIAPGLDVLATVVRAAAPEEVWAPHRATGSCFVSVQPPEHMLRVAVEAPSLIRPATTASVTVRVASSAGDAPAESRVTLFTVDDGICGLTDHKTPDPTAFFFAPRLGGAPYYDIYARLMRVTDAQLTGFLSHTGGDDGRTFSKRLSPISARRFRPVSLATYDVPVTNGVAVIPVDVPEFTGRLRFMAVAWTASATGSGEAFAHVRRNLVVQPDLPRILAPGDRSVLSVSLDNTTSSSADVACAVTCAGPVAAGKVPDPFTMAGRTRRTLSIPVTASNDVGVGRVTVRVAAAGEVFEDTIEIPVRPAAALRTLNATATLAPGASIDFPSVTGILASSASQSVEILARPTCDIRAALDYLTAYPHGCAEQTTSRAYPFLSVRKMPDGYFPEELRARADAFIHAAVVRDLTMVRYNGVAMWPDAPEVSAFATAYVVRFLAEAHRAGYARELIDVSMLESLVDRRFRDVEADEENCALLLDLALLGRPDKRMMADWLEKVDSLSGEARGQLARAFALCGDPATARKLLAEAGDPTNLRAAAFLLEAWAAIDPAHARCRACVDYLNAAVDRSCGHWGTTQNNALAINALVAYAATQGGDSAPATLSASLAVLTGNHPETIVFPAGKDAFWKSREGQGNSSCRVANTGDATCYVRRVHSAAPLADAQPPASNGLAVAREYLDRDGRPVDPAHLARGSIVVVRLAVRAADDRDDLVVEDLLPACLEPECKNLVTAGTLAWLPQSDAWRWVAHSEFRDDRVLLFSGRVKGGKTYTWHYSARVVSAGDYVVPAVQASAMYDPRVVARGALSRLSVAK